MPEIKQIPLKLKKPVGFFSEYHQAELYLSLNGYFTVQSDRPLSKTDRQIAESELKSALQSALTLAAKETDICSFLADQSSFEVISEFMKVCLDDWQQQYGTEFISINPSKVSFDKESIEVIKTFQNMQNNIEQFHVQPENSWKCIKCGCINDSKFCKDCGTAKPETWKCVCGAENTGAFCTECGTAKDSIWQCSCGSLNKNSFCPQCGKPRNY